MTAVGRVNLTGLPFPSREEGCSIHYHISAPGRSQEAGSLPVNIHQFQRSEAARDAGGKGPAARLPPHMRRPELAAPAPGSVSSREGPGQREHGPSNDPCPRCRQGHLALALAGSPQMLSSRPNSSPHSKGVRCHLGAQNAGKQMETSNCAALAPQISQPPSSTPDPGQGTRRRVSTPACRVRSCHAQAETTRCPAGPGDWEVLTLSSPRRSSGQLRTGLPHSLFQARPTTRAGSPRPGPTTAAPGGTLGPRTPRPARAGERRGRPARGREGRTEGLRTGGRCLPRSGPA